MRIRLTLLAAALLVAAPLRAQTPGEPLQAVVSVSAGWDSTTARVRLFQRATPASPWVQVGAEMDASVGRGGVGWGTGMHPEQAGGGPVKREGDGRAPAGVFRLSSAFGYAPARSARWIRLPYHASTPSVECVDDTASRFYNQRVDRDTLATPDWTSHEEMRRGDALYRWGVWADHNTGPAVAGRGSCIFIHVRARPGAPTSGCTALAEADVRRILAWLDPRARPVLVQLPEAEYRRLRGEWRLP